MIKEYLTEILERLYGIIGGFKENIQEFQIHKFYFILI